MSKSAMTPSFSGRIAWMCSGVRPIILFGFDADRERTTVARVDRDDRRLVEHDAAAAHVDEGVGGAEVDRHVAAEQSCVERFAHASSPSDGRYARRLASPPGYDRIQPTPSPRRAPRSARAHSRELGEEQRDLARSRLRTVASVHEVLRQLDREIAADRAGRRLARVRRRPSACARPSTRPGPRRPSPPAGSG